MKKALFFLLFPLFLTGADSIRIEGEQLAGWGVFTPQGIVTAAHLLFQDSTWHCENGEPEWVIADTERDLICLQSGETAGHAAKLVFPPGELPQGSVVNSDGKSIVLRGLNTVRGDSGKPLFNAAGEVYGVVIGRKIQDNEIYTLAARVDKPVAGKRIPIKEFRSWNVRYAQLYGILSALRKLSESDEEATARDRAALLLKQLPLENSSPGVKLSEKHHETLKEVVRIAVWLGLTPYGERMYRLTPYSAKRWHEKSKNASLILTGKEWAAAGFCNPQKEWRWVAFCKKGPFAGSIMAFGKN